MASGVYKDTLQTALGCDSVVITTLVVHLAPHPNLGEDRALCADSLLTLSPGRFAGYEWQDQSTDTSFATNAAGLYWVKVTDTNQCSAVDTLIITNLLPRPSRFLKETDSLCTYGTVLIKPLGNYQSYLWSTGATSAAIEVSTTGSYWLKVRDGNGCTGMDTTTISPKQCMQGIYLPTAFTPNGDGKNDVFKALVFGKLKAFKLQLFNRWGQLIFQSEDPRKGWDGKINALPGQSDVFVWLCLYQLDGEAPRTEKGTVTLVR